MLFQKPTSAFKLEKATSKGDRVSRDAVPRTEGNCQNAKLKRTHMSCSGNFKTLEQAILEYGADAMRIALADAGDAMDDANFEHQTANGAILRLTKEVRF
jgi:leucyl-tRNA synthetase